MTPPASGSIPISRHKAVQVTVSSGSSNPQTPPAGESADQRRRRLRDLVPLPRVDFSVVSRSGPSAEPASAASGADVPGTSAVPGSRAASLDEPGLSAGEERGQPSSSTALSPKDHLNDFMARLDVMGGDDKRASQASSSGTNVTEVYGEHRPPTTGKPGKTTPYKKSELDESGKVIAHPSALILKAGAELTEDQQRDLQALRQRALKGEKIKVSVVGGKGDLYYAMAPTKEEGKDKLGHPSLAKAVEKRFADAGKPLPWKPEGVDDPYARIGIEIVDTGEEESVLTDDSGRYPPKKGDDRAKPYLRTAAQYTAWGWPMRYEPMDDEAKEQARAQRQQAKQPAAGKAGSAA